MKDIMTAFRRTLLFPLRGKIITRRLLVQFKIRVYEGAEVYSIASLELHTRESTIN
jgi:hypothetical protein